MPLTLITKMAMMMTITALISIRCTMVMMMMVMLLVISVVRRHGKSKIKVGIRIEFALNYTTLYKCRQGCSRTRTRAVDVPSVEDDLRQTRCSTISHDSHG